MRFLTVPAVMLAAAVPAWACPLSMTDGPLTAKSPSHSVAAVPSADPITVGQPFSLTLEACGADGTPFQGVLKPDAHMPAHRHGMNYRPSVTDRGGGKYRIDGFVFHMPGQWQFVFELQDGADSDRLLIDHMVK